MPSYDPASLLPAELPKDFPKRFVAWIAEHPIRDDSDLERIVACDKMISALSERRKRQNKVLIELEKEWQEARRKLRADVVAVLQSIGDEGKMKVTGGMIYESTAPGVTLISDEIGALGAVVAHLGGMDAAIESGHVVVETKLTSDGKKLAKSIVELRSAAGGDLPPWARKTRPEKNFAVKVDESEQRKRFNYEKLVEDYFLDNPVVEVEDVDGLRDFGDLE